MAFINGYKYTNEADALHTILNEAPFWCITFILKVIP